MSTTHMVHMAVRSKRKDLPCIQGKYKNLVLFYSC